jgi:glycosyltransferase involved in cell wall biosynthesis
MIVLIPAYQPDDRLLTLVAALGHHRVVVVDDGSGPAYREVFAGLEGAELITLDHNRGKGFALRAGFAHIAARHPGTGVICADSDGQHRPEDITAVAAQLVASGADMVLGVRRFTGRVPARSRLGNSVTRQLFRLVTGLDVTDTQTGLRGYPARMLAWLGDVPGDRFEYELRLLLHAARESLAVTEVPIATVYLDGNRSSHFRPVRDSARVYAPLLAFAASSLLAFGVDAALLAGLVTVTGEVVASAVGARLISATLNYTVNRRAVFGGLVSHRRAFPRYAALAAASLSANVLLLQAATAVTGSLAIAKVVTEATLFLAGFTAQRALVFNRAAPLSAFAGSRRPPGRAPSATDPAGTRSAAPGPPSPRPAPRRHSIPQA